MKGYNCDHVQLCWRHNFKDWCYEEWGISMVELWKTSYFASALLWDIGAPECALHCLLKISSLCQNSVRFTWTKKMKKSCILWQCDIELFHLWGCLAYCIFQWATLNWALPYVRRSQKLGKAHANSTCTRMLLEPQQSAPVSGAVPKQGIIASLVDPESRKFRVGVQIPGCGRPAAYLKERKLAFTVQLLHQNSSVHRVSCYLAFQKIHCVSSLGSSLLQDARDHSATLPFCRQRMCL